MSTTLPIRTISDEICMEASESQQARLLLLGEYMDFIRNPHKPSFIQKLTKMIVGDSYQYPLDVAKGKELLYKIHTEVYEKIPDMQRKIRFAQKSLAAQLRLMLDQTVELKIQMEEARSDKDQLLLNEEFSREKQLLEEYIAVLETVCPQLNLLEEQLENEASALSMALQRTRHIIDDNKDAEEDERRKQRIAKVKHYPEAFARMRKRIEADRNDSGGYSHAAHLRKGNLGANYKDDDTSTLLHSPSSPFSPDDGGGGGSGSDGAGSDG